MVCKIRRLAACVGLLGAMGCLALAGCGADDQSVGGPNNLPPAQPRAEAMSTGQITAVLSSIDEAETKQAQTALERLEDDIVRGYARKVLTAHEAAEMEVDALTHKFGTKPEASAMKKELEQLADQTQRSIADESVARLPMAYLDAQVQMHKKALVMTDKMQDAAQPTELRSYLENYRAMLKQHLDEAQDLRKRFPER